MNWTELNWSRSSPRTSRRLYSCTYRPSPAITFATRPSRTSWCSGSKRVQATLRAEDRTRLLLDFSHTTRLISASAPLRTWLRANTLALSKVRSRSSVVLFFHLYLHFLSTPKPDLPTWCAGFDPRHPSVKKAVFRVHMVQMLYSSFSHGLHVELNVCHNVLK